LISGCKSKIFLSITLESKVKYACNKSMSFAIDIKREI